MKRKELERIVEMLWPSHTTAKGTVYEPMTPELFATLWLAMDEANAEQRMVKAYLETVD